MTSARSKPVVTSANYSETTRPPATSSPYRTGQRLKPMDDFVDYLKTYARQRPGTAALWCFGVGFVVGWKLKPW
jgi:hypothetical protein